MTQNDLILEALQRGETLTPYTGLQVAGSLRLSERIRELEKDGVSIIHEWVKVGKKKVMGYKLGFPHG